MMSASLDFLNQFQPSETRLLDWLRPQIDRTMLQEIAEADYGYDAQAHFAVLLNVHQGEPLPVPLDWVPHEVLALTRWTDPDDLSLRGGSKGIRGHLIRAFACTLLVRAATEPANQSCFDGDNETIIQLVDSVILLGQEAAEATLSFLAWCVPQVPETFVDRAFYAMAMLLLQVFLAKGESHQEEAILQTCDWVIEEEAWFRNEAVNPDWLLGLTCYDQRHKIWKALTQQLLLEPAIAHSAQVAELLELIGLSLVGG